LLFDRYVNVKEQAEDDEPKSDAQNDEDLIYFVTLLREPLAGRIETARSRALLEFIEADAALHGHRHLGRFFGCSRRWRRRRPVIPALRTTSLAIIDFCSGDYHQRPHQVKWKRRDVMREIKEKKARITYSASRIMPSRSSSGTRQTAMWNHAGRATPPDGTAH